MSFEDFVTASQFGINAGGGNRRTWGNNSIPSVGRLVYVRLEQRFLEGYGKCDSRSVITKILVGYSNVLLLP